MSKVIFSKKSKDNRHASDTEPFKLTVLKSSNPLNSTVRVEDSKPSMAPIKLISANCQHWFLKFSKNILALIINDLSFPIGRIYIFGGYNAKYLCINTKGVKVMHRPNIKRKSKNFRLTNLTIQELKRLSAKLKTSMTQIIEISVSRYSQDQQHGDAENNNNKNGGIS